MGDRDVRIRVDVEDKFERLAQSARKAAQDVRVLQGEVDKLNRTRGGAGVGGSSVPVPGIGSQQQLQDAIQKTAKVGKKGFGDLDRQVLGMSKNVRRTTDDLRQMRGEMAKAYLDAEAAKKAGRVPGGIFASNAGASSVGFFAAGASLAGSQFTAAAGNGVSADAQRNRLLGGTLSGAGSGAALGFAAAGLPGAAVGAGVGGAMGYMNALEQNTKALEENRKAIQDANRRADRAVSVNARATDLALQGLQVQDVGNRFTGQNSLNQQRQVLNSQYQDNQATLGRLASAKRNTNSREQAAGIAQEELAILNRQRQIYEDVLRIRQQEVQAAVAANKLETQRLETLRRVREQEANIARAKADAAQKTLQGAAEQFASLTPAEQAERKSLESRLAKGKQLSPEQLLRARQLGSNLDETGQQLRQRANERGFLDTVGGARLNEAADKANRDAEQAEKRLGKVEAEIKVQLEASQQLAKQIEEAVAPIQEAIIQAIRESLLKGKEVTNRQISINRLQSLGGS